MNTYDIDTLQDLTSPILLKELHKAHWRYLSLAGIGSEITRQDIVTNEKKTHPHCIKHDGYLTVLSDTDCVVFMVEAIGFPPIFCEAWMRYDYYDELKHEIHPPPVTCPPYIHQAQEKKVNVHEAPSAQRPHRDEEKTLAADDTCDTDLNYYGRCRNTLDNPNR